MACQEFLAARRPLLARVGRDVPGLLCDPAYAPECPAPAEPEPVATGRACYGAGIGDLTGAGLLEAGDILISAGGGGDASTSSGPRHGTTAGRCRSSLGSLTLETTLTGRPGAVPAARLDNGPAGRAATPG